MTIRNRLILLLSVPLVALVIVGAFGFSQQSIDAEKHESAAESVDGVARLDAIARYVAGERLEFFANGDAQALEDAEAATDSAIARAGESQDANVRSLADSLQVNLESARQATRIDRLDGYRSILDVVDEYVMNASIDGYSADDIAVVHGLQQARVAANTQEEAWFDVLTIGEVTPEAIDETSRLFEAAAGERADAAALFTQDGLRPFAPPTNSATAVQLVAQETVASRDIVGGQLPQLDSAEIFDALRANRGEWNSAADNGVNFLRNSIETRRVSTDTDRSLFTLLSLLAALLLAALIFVVSRSVVGPIQRLISEAEAISTDRLPAAVAQLRTVGSSDDIPEIKPIPREADDEIGSLVDAFNEVHGTAFDIATDQARSRRNVAEMFVSLGRRNQQLNHRMLSLISELEQNQQDPELLDGLYRLDHLATRMRRNAESLLVLAGNRSPRQWSRPVSTEDILRSALAEVENFERIEVGDVPEAHIRGAVVTDVTHLLAELLDNATNFSDPSSKVTISAHETLEGLEIEIVDHGFGIGPEDLEELNDRIDNPPALDEAPTRLLGLFVVGRLAQQHGIDVELQSKPGVGTVATVALPSKMIPDEVFDSPTPLQPIEMDPGLGEEVRADLGLDDDSPQSDSGLEAALYEPDATHENALADASVPTEEEMAEAISTFPSVSEPLAVRPTPEPPAAEVELPLRQIQERAEPAALPPTPEQEAQPPLSEQAPEPPLPEQATLPPLPEEVQPMVNPGLPPLPADPPAVEQALPPLPPDPVAQPPATPRIFDTAPPVPVFDEVAPPPARMFEPEPIGVDPMPQSPVAFEPPPVEPQVFEPSPVAPPAAETGFGGLPVRSPQAALESSAGDNVMPLPGVDPVDDESTKPERAKTTTAGAFAAFASGVSRGLHAAKAHDQHDEGEEAQ